MSNPPSASSSSRVTQLKSSVMAAFDGTYLSVCSYARIAWQIRNLSSTKPIEIKSPLAFLAGKVSRAYVDIAAKKHNV